MPRRRPSKVSDENPANPVVTEFDLGLAKPKPLLEKQIRQQIWELLAYDHRVKLFRNATGVAHIGRCTIPYGLKVGSADLIGWKTITITPDMVGHRIAAFCSVELKTDTGRLGPKQQEWMDLVLAAGGIAGVARSAEEAKNLLQ